MAYYFPILLIVTSNVLYHLCAKSIPLQMNPMVSLMVTYLVAGAGTLALFFFLPDLFSGGSKSGTGLLAQFRMTNWAPVVLGIVIVGLELGNILMYRAGWNISLGSLVANISLAVILVAVGVLLYKEVLSGNQLLGIALCLAGLFFINRPTL
jgi:drug/metabolite transporter (DMT)-like permease